MVTQTKTRLLAYMRASIAVVECGISYRDRYSSYYLESL